MMIDSKTRRRFAGKSVLQLGVLGDYRSYFESDRLGDWDFPVVSAEADYCLGVDKNEAGVTAANERGYDMILYGDAENLDVGQKFDVVYAGDLIEHLSNLQGFFDSCRRHMRPESSLFVATPNPYSLALLVAGLFSSIERRIFDEHTLLLHPKNLTTLAERHDFQMVDLTYYTIVDRRNAVVKVKSLLSHWAGCWRQNLHQAYVAELTLV